MKNEGLIRKGQTGIYLAVAIKRLLLNISNSTGLSMSQVVSLAIQEYAWNHREELKFYRDLIRDKDGNF